MSDFDLADNKYLDLLYMGYKKKGYRKKAYAKTRVDKKQNSQLKTLFRRTKKEKKWIDQNHTDVITTAWDQILLRPLTYISQGDGNGTRVGNKVSLVSLHIKGFLTVNDETNIVRIMCVRFGRANPSQIQVQEVLDDSGAPSPNHLISFKKRNGNLSYDFLWDKTFLLAGNNTSDATVGSRTQYRFSKSVNLTKTPMVTWDDNADTTPSNGFIYLIASSDSTVSGPTVNVQTRLIYTD